jgi:hypothetical protein
MSDERSSERGAVLIMVTAAMLLLFGVAAMAVDLSALRGDIRSDRLAADAAATAGAIKINPSSGSSADEACQTAWEYLLLNLEDEGGTISPPNCGAMASSCGTTARFATATAGPYSIEITHPVLDSDPLMSGQAPNEVIDGAACQRLGVEITRDRDYAFAPVLGFDSGTTHVGAVARVDINAGEPEVVPLLVLEPVSCDALYASGQGSVTVAHYMDTPGIIVVDSNGSGGSGSLNCNNGNRWTIDAKGNNNGWIRALPTDDADPIQPAILSFALSGTPGANASKSYDPNDLTTGTGAVLGPPESWFRLYPRPQASYRRITRAPIDWRYNCQPTYPDYLGIVEVDGCSAGTPAHIDLLEADYGGTGSPGFSWNMWTDSHSCSPAADAAVAGNWYVDCPGGFIVNGVDIIFSSGDVVFDGTVDLRSSGTLTVNTTSEDRVVYVRGTGNLIKTAQASITLNQTMVYLAGGYLDLVGGSGGLRWTAPLAGDFEDLALWAEAEAEFEIGGQAGNLLTGTFFTPLSNPFILAGQAGQFQTSAQFLTRRLEVGGQGEVLMHPDPDRQTPIPTLAVRLIR